MSAIDDSEEFLFFFFFIIIISCVRNFPVTPDENCTWHVKGKETAAES